MILANEKVYRKDQTSGLELSIHTREYSNTPDSVLLTLFSNCYGHSTTFHLDLNDFRELVRICNSLNRSLSKLQQRAKEAEERDVA